MEKITIAIDGYAGCGKSTTAKGVAKELGYIYIDTGAMYRAVSLYFTQKRIDFYQDTDVLLNAVKEIQIDFVRDPQTGENLTRLNGQVVESEIRKPQISNIVSLVSIHASVREAMVAQQRQMGHAKGVVLDGRDIGTVVFPDAELKVFMTAEMEVRAGRRLAELQQKGVATTLEEVIENLKERDRIDTTRKIAPLKQAADSIVLDTTDLVIDQQIALVSQWAKQRMHNFQQNEHRN
ncbi:MAG: (d)CMP kinase [Bacteroidota bacterium]